MENIAACGQGAIMTANAAVAPDELIPMANVPYEEFCKFVQKHGFTVERKKNKGEFIRLKTPTGKKMVMMARKDGYLNVYSGVHRRLLEAFLSGSDDISEPVPSLTPRGRLVEALFKRDGTQCAYCGKELTHTCATIEHVVPKSAQGPSNLHNYVLTCMECNSRAGALPVADKIRLMAHRCAGSPVMLPEVPEEEGEKDTRLMNFVLSFSLLVLLGFALWDDWGCLLRAV